MQRTELQIALFLDIQQLLDAEEELKSRLRETASKKQSYIKLHLEELVEQKIVRVSINRQELYNRITGLKKKSGYNSKEERE